MSKTPLGALGEARRARRNSRVQHVEQKGWRFRRIQFFQRNLRFAAAAKAYRTALDVTQEEVATNYGVSIGTVSVWESGKYAWRGGQEELNEYLSVVRRIAEEPA